MNFSEVLSQYFSRYNITISEFSAETGISKSMLSRMKSGKKEPTASSELLERISKGIAEFAERCGDTQTDFDSIKASLSTSANKAEQFDMPDIAKNLNHLISALSFRASDLSRHLNFDASYLSLIRSGKRSPSDIASFCIGVADYISTHYESNISLLSSVLGCEQSELQTRSSRKEAVYKWLTHHAPQEDNSTLKFLKSLDLFNLNDFISALQFNEDAVMLSSAQQPLQKNYYTKNGFMQAELTWLNSVITSPSNGPVLFYSDMPFEEISKNKDFSKQWMVGIALLLKKGIHLNMIHQLDRQDSEMMLGLEAWIPLYMTGQVTPYYLKNNQNPYFHHFLRISDTAVLSGEAITGFYDDGRYHFSRSKEDIAYYKNKADALLTKAQPLMSIYRHNNSEKYHTFLKSQYQINSSVHHNILSIPPIYTMSNELLRNILLRNNASSEEIEKITAYALEYRKWAENALKSSAITDEIFLISESDFNNCPVSLPLADLFSEREYTYSYEEYLAHLQETKDFANANRGYTASLNTSAGFRNIQIRIAEGNFIIISKEKCPTAHFVIHHTKLRCAIEHLTIPVIE